MEKILIFETSNTRDYWFKYIIRKLKDVSNEKCILFKIYFFSKEIWINGNRIMFITLREKIDKVGMADRFTRYYYFMEHRLEKNFKETLKEILLDG